jgi:hypothetical protein
MDNITGASVVLKRSVFNKVVESSFNLASKPEICPDRLNCKITKQNKLRIVLIELYILGSRIEPASSYLF